MTISGKLRSFLLPSLADILFVTLLLTLSLFDGQKLLGDGDTGYHIRAGEFILDSHSIPRHDMFSFITPALPWTAHEWLSEIIMALVHRAGGLTGVVTFFSFLIAITFYIYFRIIRRASGNIYLSILLVMLVVASAKIHFLARPHIFSLPLLVTWYFLLDAYHYENRDRLYLLPILMLFWVNLHGGYVVGFFLLGVYLLGNLVYSVTGQDETRRLARIKAKKLGVMTVACLAVSLINPFGYHILLFPFTLVSDRFMMDHVQEFLSPNFHESGFFKYVLLGLIVLFAATREKLNIIELILVVFFLNMSLYSVRYIPLFAIIVAPIILRRCNSLLTISDNGPVRFLKKSAERISYNDASARGLVWPAAAMVLVAVFVVSGRTKFTFDETIKPVAAVDFLLKEKISGNMFNNDEFGDYVVYRSYPFYKVFIDGRLDMYGTKQFKEYFKVTHIEQGWEKVLEKYQIDWILFNANTVLTQHIMGKQEWRLIYADKVSNIFVRNIPKYQGLIDKYRNVKPVVVEEKTDAS